jgi:hypothetical protein
MTDLPLCKCGCGLQVERSTKTYYDDHYRHPVGPPVVEIDEEEQIEIQEASLTLSAPVPEPVKQYIETVREEIRVEKKPIVPIVKKKKKKIKKTPPQGKSVRLTSNLSVVDGKVL